MIAQQEKGATIIIEHRFFGESNPYNNLSTASLSLLTVEQSISDLVYFAENVKLPMPGGDAVSPKQAPWVLIGGSYPGALTAWAKVVYVFEFDTGLYFSLLATARQTHFTLHMLHPPSLRLLMTFGSTLSLSGNTCLQTALQMSRR